MIPSTDRVQNQADGKTVQPESKRSVNAAGTRLRRRLSNIFHWDSHGERILLKTRIGAGNARQQPSQELPIAANPAMPAAHVRIVAGRIFLIEHAHRSTAPPARNTLPEDRG